MESQKYAALLDEVFDFMKGTKLDSALREDKSPSRVDAVLDIMRDAVKRSSISKFNGSLYYFGGRIYEEMSWDDFGNLIYDLMRKCNLPNGDYARIENILRVCRRVVSGKQLKQNNAIMVFNNCVFDMQEGKRHDFSKDYVQTTQVSYNYNPKDYIFIWKQFLDEVLPDKNMQKVLQEFIGSIFINRSEAKMETMLVLKGAGSNGKSVIFETIMGILGRENVSNFGIDALISGNERKKNIAFINGKRLNYCSEIQALEFGKDSDALKSLISGEPTEARPMYGENFTAYNLPLLMANANQMPYLKDWSYGMRRRICILPFDIEIPKERQRKSLARDMESEYPAIFNWILEGRKRFISNGYKFTDCRELETIMDEYQSESNSVMRFMYRRNYLCRYEDVADIEPKWMVSTNLYSEYRRWCRDNEEDCESVTKFGKILGEAGYRKKRSPRGILYGIFGQPIIGQYEYQRKGPRMKSESYKKRISQPIVRNGKKYAHTSDGLAMILSLSPARIGKLCREGVFDGLYHHEGTARIFDIVGCERKLRQLGIIGVSDLEKEHILKERSAAKDKRKTFNARMRDRQLPFRKYEKPNQKGDYIHVPDDWVYSDVEARKMLIAKMEEEKTNNKTKNE